VLKEALRLYPPFATSLPTETASNGMTLNGYHIPGGTQVMVGGEPISNIIIIMLSSIVKYRNDVPYARIF
jgi:hypothetical protein